MEKKQGLFLKGEVVGVNTTKSGKTILNVLVDMGNGEKKIYKVLAKNVRNLGQELTVQITVFDNILLMEC